MLDSSQQQIIARILTTVAEYKASDLHLTVGNPPILRIDGELKMLEKEEMMTPELLQTLVDGLLNDTQKQELLTHRDITVSYTFQDRIRFRMNVFYQKEFPSLSLRFIPDRIPTPKELGLPPIAEGFTQLHQGLLLFVGPYGSGKTTTIASLLQNINRERNCHIMTIEDPIEYLFVNEKAIIEQREVGRDAASMLAALNLADHEDVDIIFVSGMKSPEVLHKVLELSSSDRLIFASLSADSIMHGLEQITSSYPEDLRNAARISLSETLQASLGQRLIHRIGGGQILVPEVLIPTTSARAVIREGEFRQLVNIMTTSRDQGMISRDRVLVECVQKGLITLDDAKSHAYDPDQFEMMVRG